MDEEEPVQHMFLVAVFFKLLPEIVYLCLSCSYYQHSNHRELSRLVLIENFCHG